MPFLFKPIDLDTKMVGREDVSRVREHLANERTYLAWMRSAIALMAFGVVVVRLRAFHPPLVHHPGNTWKLGLLLSLVGLVTVLLSTGHYFAVRRDIDFDTYELADRWVLLLSLAVMILGSVVIYFVFTTPFSPISFVVPDTNWGEHLTQMEQVVL
jgi:putative membrane protein